MYHDGSANENSRFVLSNDPVFNKLGYSPVLARPIARERKDLMDYKLGYLSADIICSEKQTVFRERSSRKIVSFEEQIISKDKYPSIFSPPSEVLEIGECSRVFHSFSWKIFGHVTCLDQTRASKNMMDYNGSYSWLF